MDVDEELLGEGDDDADTAPLLVLASTRGDGEPGEESKPKLARHLTLVGGIALTVGTIVGSGIFVSPNGVVRNTGSVGAALFVWIGCGIVAGMAALCFCELGCAIPSAGGVYSYILYIYGRMVAFLFVWTFELVANPAGLAIINLTLAEYFVSIFSEDAQPWAVKLTAAGFLGKDNRSTPCILTCNIFSSLICTVREFHVTGQVTTHLCI